MRVGALELGLALSAYVIAVLAVGVWASRGASKSAEEYFLAGRGLGPVVLFMALFGTNTTPFVLVGIPGRAYHDGVAAFGLNAPLVALGVPLTFWAVGLPARRLAEELGAMTPAELYARRLRSRAVGWLLFGLFTLYTVPYMVTGVKGAALALDAVTGGAIPPWLGGLVVVGTALVYTTLGGMRATAWTNVLQGALFLAVLLLALGWILADEGGLAAAMEQVRASAPALLERPETPLYRPAGWTSWGIAIALTVIAFPHMLVRLMAARDTRALGVVTAFYPWALILLWVPAVLIGVLGAVEFPGLEGGASDRIFSLMTAAHLPPFLAAMAFVAVLAAVMSTLDAQILTLGSMLTRDVLTRDVLAPAEVRPRQTPPESGRKGVRHAQAFGALVALLTYGLSVLWGASVFDIAKVAFSGYVTLVPTLLLGVRWERFSAKGALGSMLVGNAILGAGLLELFPMGGFLPAFWAFLGALIAAVVVTFISERSARATDV